MQQKVGILTWHQYHNFGSMLQAYALQTTIGKLGLHCEIINYFDLATMSPPDRLDDVKYLVKKALSCAGFHKLLPHYYSFERFYHDRLRKTKTVTERDELKNLTSKYHSIVFGSDQIWAPNVYNPVYMGDFLDDPTKKLVSYAASIGLNDIPEELRPVYRSLLSRFSRISVREEMGKKLLKEHCGLDAEVVLDPTLLLEASEYRKIQKPVSKFKERYVFCYFLNKDHHYHQRVEEYAKLHGYKVVGVSVCEQDGAWMELLPATGPQEFLWLVDHAEAVFTDSYHGTIFSLQFHKKFWTFERFAKDDPICQNSRIQQLNHLFGIGARILAPDDPVDDRAQLDYEEIDTKLYRSREKSVRFLQEALL